MKTLFKFPELDNKEEKALLSMLEYKGFKMDPDDPDLYIRRYGSDYQVHFVWNSDGHWEVELLGNYNDIIQNHIESEWLGMLSRIGELSVMPIFTDMVKEEVKKLIDKQFKNKEL